MLLLLDLLVQALFFLFELVLQSALAFLQRLDFVEEIVLLFH